MIEAMKEMRQENATFKLQCEEFKSVKGESAGAEPMKGWEKRGESSGAEPLETGGK